MLRKIEFKALFTVAPAVALSAALVFALLATTSTKSRAISLASIESSSAVSSHADSDNSPIYTIAAKGIGRGGKHGSGSGGGNGGGGGNGNGGGTGKAGRVMQRSGNNSPAWFGQSAQTTSQFGQSAESSGVFGKYSKYTKESVFNKYGTFNKFAQYGEFAKDSYTGGKYGQFSYKPW